MLELRNDFDAPTVLADRCDAFTGDLDEPAICTGCGWLRDEHPDLAHPVAA